MNASFLREDYTDKKLKAAKGQPETCRFKDHSNGEVIGSVLCQHPDFRGLMCIEDWCLSFIKKELHYKYKRPEEGHSSKSQCTHLDTISGRGRGGR